MRDIRVPAFSAEGNCRHSQSGLHALPPSEGLEWHLLSRPNACLPFAASGHPHFPGEPSHSTATPCVLFQGLGSSLLGESVVPAVLLKRPYRKFSSWPANKQEASLPSKKQGSLLPLALERLVSRDAVWMSLWHLLVRLLGANFLPEFSVLLKTGKCPLFLRLLYCMR